MLRHLIVTFLIVTGVYLALLIAIGHPFVANAQDNPASKASLSVAEPIVGVSSAVKSTAQANKTEDVSVKGSTGVAITIFGIKKNIDFDLADKEVTDAWTEFSNNKSLQNNVDWNKGKVTVYAYFYNFNSDMSKGILAIGFDGNDLLLSSDATSATLPKGRFLEYKYNSSNGTAEEKAWEAAYRHKNLIERHTLDSAGEIIASDVIVVQ